MNEPESNAPMENKCPQCGSPLPSGVLAGLCPACLFKQGAAADTAAAPETTAFQPPTVEEIAKLFEPTAYQGVSQALIDRLLASIDGD